MSDSNISHARKLLDCRLPSPVSVLEHSSFADSCNSSDAADSNSTGGKRCASTIVQVVHHHGDKLSFYFQLQVASSVHQFKPRKCLIHIP